MRKKRRIYYVPGLITLIILPILCYFYLKPYIKDERCLEIVFCEKYQKKDSYQNSIRFDTTFLSNPDTKRIYKTIYLNGNNDLIKLDSFRLGIHNMIESKDSVNGFHLVFQDCSKYGTFIQAINICKHESLFYYPAFENHIWTLYKRIENDLLERIKSRRKEAEIKNKEKLLERSIEKTTFLDKFRLSLKIWPVLIVFTILAIISINKMRKI